jgi:hypothetical protein
VTQSQGQPPLNPEQAQPPQVVVVQSGNGLGVAGFVCGLLAVIAGITFAFVLTAPLGLLSVIFGWIGWRRARRDPARGGKGLSVAGIILGFIGLALTVFAIWIIGSFATGD